MSPPRPVFAANWKMHKGPGETRRFAAAFAARHPPREDATVVLFPPAISIPALIQATAARPDLEVGVQDVHEEREGAHTGAVSAPMAADAGAAWGLAGHSERRREFGDDDRAVARKTGRLLEAGLRPVLCVGETLEEREAGRLEEVLHRQVDAVLSGLSPEEASRLLFAYEPVWAIGTGRTARSEDAGAAHAIIRREAAGHTDEETARRARILYGGSVKPGNIVQLLEAEGVDGVLVGGASLEPESFARICAAGL